MRQDRKKEHLNTRQLIPKANQSWSQCGSKHHAYQHQSMNRTKKQHQNHQPKKPCRNLRPPPKLKGAATEMAEAVLAEDVVTVETVTTTTTIHDQVDDATSKDKKKKHMKETVLHVERLK